MPHNPYHDESPQDAQGFKTNIYDDQNASGEPGGLLQASDKWNEAGNMFANTNTHQNGIDLTGLKGQYPSNQADWTDDDYQAYNMDKAGLLPTVGPLTFNDAGNIAYEDTSGEKPWSGDVMRVSDHLINNDSDSWTSNTITQEEGSDVGTWVHQSQDADGNIQDFVQPTAPTVNVTARRR